MGAFTLLPRSIARSAGPISTQDVQDGWSGLRRLYEFDDSHGGARAYQLAVSMARDLDEALNRGTYSPSVAPELHKLATATMEHAGWLAFDSERSEDARQWWLEAGHLADVTGNPDARIAALLSMSLQASTVHRGREAVLLVSTAREVAGSTAPSRLLSLFSAREGVGHALSGDSRTAHSAFSEARDRLSQESDEVPDDSESLWLDFWSAADLACHESRAALALDDRRWAEQSARTAYSTVDRHAFPRNHVIYAVRLGSILTLTGQLEEAVAVATEAVELTDSVRGSRRIVRELRSTIGLLGDAPFRPAKEFASVARRVLADT